MRKQHNSYSIVMVGIVALALFLIVNSASAQVVRPLTDIDISRWYSYAIDDTGTWVYSTSNTNLLGANPDQRYQIVRWDPDTGDGEQVTGFTEGVSGVSVSDDGQWLAFASSADPVATNSDNSLELFMMQSDATGISQLTFDTCPAYASIIAGSANRIVFTSDGDPLSANPDNYIQLFIIDSDGTDLTQLTNAPDGYFQSFSVSDDGDRIVFSHRGDLTGSNPSNRWQIFAVNADGSSLRQLTTFDEDSRNAEISGDGSKVAFDSQANPFGQNIYGRSQIFMIDWDGTGLDELTTCSSLNQCSDAGYPKITDDAEVVFYQDEKAIFLTKDNPEIWRMAADGTGKTQLTFTEEPITNASKTVSGSGNIFVFGSTEDFPGGNNPDGNEELVAMNSSGGDIQQLSITSEGHSWDPDITHDGSRIVFSSDADLLGTNGEAQHEIYRVEADGTDLFQVTDFVSGRAHHASITADGNIIAFSWHTYDGSFDCKIYSIHADGSQLTQLPSSEYGISPDIAADGSWIVFSDDDDLTGENPDGSTEIFRVRPDGTGLYQLTDNVGASFGEFELPRIDDNGVWVVYDTRGDPLGSNPDGSEEIYRVRSDGTGYEAVTADPTYSSFYPDISGVGDRIVYVSYADPFGTNPDHGTELFLYEPGTSAVTQLTDTTADGWINRPRISGNGAWVIFTSTKSFFEASSTCHAYRLEVATGLIERTDALASGFCDSGVLEWGAGMALDSTGDLAVFHGIDWTGVPGDNHEIMLVDRTVPAHIEVGKESPTVVTWDVEPQPKDYDVIRGDVAGLQTLIDTIDLGTVVCIENDSGNATTEGFEDTEDPLPGQAFFYLHRGSQGSLDGPGSYGTGSDGSERTVGDGDCEI